MSNEKKEYKQNPKFPNVGAMILKKEKDAFGNPAYYIKVNDGVEVTVNGKKVTSLNIQRPIDKYNYMLEQGKITPELFEEKQELYSPEGEKHYVKFELTADLRDPSEKKRN